MKIIFSDFDGTLFYDNCISERDLTAIEKFRKLGNKFGIVTGRDIDNGLIISRGNIFKPDFTICCTGAIIMDETGKIIYQKTAPSGDFFDKLIKKAIELKATLFMISDGLVKYNVDVWGVNKVDLSGLKKYTQANTWFTTIDDAKAFTDYVNQNFEGLVCAHQNGLGVDLPPPNTSKVTGIYEYASYFKDAEIITVGDNVNDIEMITHLNGFAVENAVDSVKACTKNHCGRIADLIEKVLS
jgi:hydroxymethylpyrimidine pyrophosphatase-like HAD family hydrolase